MSPTNPSFLFSPNTPNIEYKVIPACDCGIQPQIIISRVVGGIMRRWNFNAAIEESNMGLLCSGMDALFDIPRGHYKRIIAPDHSYINIFPTDNTNTETNHTVRDASNTPNPLEARLNHAPIVAPDAENDQHGHEGISTNDIFAIVEN